MSSDAPSPRAIPDEVRRLVATDIDSFERLEVLMLLRESTTPRSLEGIASDLGLPEDLVEHACRGLRASGIVTGSGGSPPRYQLATMAHRTQDACDALCTLYEQDPAVVMNLISTLAFDRARSLVARAFGDALQIPRRRDDED
jgi:hypothetical protein